MPSAGATPLAHAQPLLRTSQQLCSAICKALRQRRGDRCVQPWCASQRMGLRLGWSGSCPVVRRSLHGSKGVRVASLLGSSMMILTTQAAGQALGHSTPRHGTLHT